MLSLLILCNGIDRRLQKEKSGGMFDGETEVDLLNKESVSGNFHARDVSLKEQYDKSVSEGHFAPLLRRIEKIDEALNDIINFQNYEREQELVFKEYQVSLYDSFFRMNVLECIVVVLAAAYSVWSLRSFFVKKSIY